MYKKSLLTSVFVSLFLCFSVLVLPCHPAHAKPTKKPTNKQVGVGLGISNAIPTIELDLRLKSFPIEFVCKYYFTRSLEISFNIYALERKYVRWHILDLGMYLPMGTKPLSAPNIRADRGMDLSFGTGIDILPWKNLVISVSLRWFLPGFASAFTAGKEAALEYAANNLDIDLSKTIEEILYENGEAAFGVSSQKVRGIYAQALAEPHLQFTITWYFF